MHQSLRITILLRVTIVAERAELYRVMSPVIKEGRKRAPQTSPWCDYRCLTVQLAGARARNMISSFTTGSAAAPRRPDLSKTHAARVQEAYSSKTLCTRPRVPMGLDIDEMLPATADQAQRLKDADLGKAVTRLEMQLVEVLYSRTTAHFGEHRVLKSAFNKFDTDNSGAIDFNEFKHALEYIGLHTQESGLPGNGGMPEVVLEALFRKYDQDGSGQLEYMEFVNALLANKDVGQLG
jgi:Ca2+-binding EF-hand superfamily protein